MDLHNVRTALSARDADLSKSSFLDTSLAESRFGDVNLAGATFTNTNLAGLVCVDVTLEGASISNANLAGMRINGILVEDLLRAYRAAGVVLYAKDVARLRGFYQNVLGFALDSRQTDHVVLVSPGLRLVIVEIPKHISASIEVGDPPRLRSESPTKLIFPTASIAATREAARDHGGNILPVEREWEFDGSRVCDGNDPEGNVFQLKQPRG